MNARAVDARNGLVAELTLSRPDDASPDALGTVLASVRDVAGEHRSKDAEAADATFAELEDALRHAVLRPQKT